MESPVKSAQCRWSTNGRASNTSLLASRREQGLYKQQAPSSVVVDAFAKLRGVSSVVVLPHGLMVKTYASHDGSTDSNPVAGAPS